MNQEHKKEISLLKMLKHALSGQEIQNAPLSIRSSILMLSVPMIMEMLMESMFSVVDIIFVSRLGKDAVAAVGLTESLMSVVYSVAIGISMAGTAIIARRYGEGKYRKAADAVIQIILVAIIFSIISGLGGILFAEELLNLLGAGPEIVKEGADFTRIIFAGNMAVTLLFVINGVFRGAGNAAIAMQSLWFANIVNLIAAPLLIFGAGPVEAMGLEGAAVATLLGRSLGVVYQLLAIRHARSGIVIRPVNFVIRKKTITRIFKLSLGGMSQFIIESLSWLFLIRLVSDYGSAALAGYTIAYRILIFTILPGWGVANAAATLVGQNMGAGKFALAEVYVWKTIKYNVIFLGVVTLFFLLSGDMVIKFFSSEPEILLHGTEALRLFSIGFVFFACGMVVSQSLNGAGDTRTPAVINIFAFIVIQLPLAFLLAKILDLKAAGVYIAIAISYAIHAALNIYFFRKGKWKTVEV
jgi:putative MATE family efflux protein